METHVNCMFNTCYCGFYLTSWTWFGIRAHGDTITTYKSFSPGKNNFRYGVAGFTRQFIFMKDSVRVNQFFSPPKLKSTRSFHYDYFLDSAKEFNFFRFGGGDVEYEFLEKAIKNSTISQDFYKFKVSDSISKAHSYYDTLYAHPILGLYDDNCFSKMNFRFLSGDSIAFRKKMEYFENKIGW